MVNYHTCQGESAILSLNHHVATDAAGELYPVGNTLFIKLNVLSLAEGSGHKLWAATRWLNESYHQTKVYLVFIFDFRTKLFELMPESLPDMSTISRVFPFGLQSGAHVNLKSPVHNHSKVSINSASTGHVADWRELQCMLKSFHNVYSVRYRSHFPVKLVVYACL